MNKVSGRVVLSGTDVGIPRLLITFYDANSASASPSDERTPPAPGSDESRWNRLGSVITDNRGTFVLAHNEDDKNADRSQRLDLILTVSTSEETCAPGQKQHTRLATCVRRNAGSVESFLIALDKARLTEAGIRVPDSEENVDDLIARRRTAAERQAKLDAESQRLFTERLERRRNFERLAQPKFDMFMSALSAVPSERRFPASARYVPRGTSVLAANQAIIKANIQGRINQATAIGIAPLSDEQAAQFQDESGRFTREIPATALENYLRPQQNGRGPDLIRIPLRLKCRVGAKDPCEKFLEENESAGDVQDMQTKPLQIAHTPLASAPIGEPIDILATITDNIGVASATLYYRGVGGSGFEGLAMTEQSPGQYAAQIPAQTAGTAYYYIQATNGSNTANLPAAGAANPFSLAIIATDIPLLIENLVKHMTPPESATIFSIHSRAGVEQVQQSVNGFTLHSGPADAPSLHDFHHLQIAFENVWQELFDDGVVNTAKDLYTELVEREIDPNEYLIDPSDFSLLSKINIDSLKKLLKTADESTDQDPDPAVLRAFEITKEQWMALGRLKKPDRKDDPFPAWNYQEWLYNIARRVIRDNTKVDPNDPNSPPKFAFTKQELEEMYLGGTSTPFEDIFGPNRGEMYVDLVNRAVRDQRRQGEQIIQYVTSGLEAPLTNFQKFHPLLDQLEKSMKEPYRFSIYAANRRERSVNFGIVATYRQKWEPVSYQVGELVKTVPLAPKEIRRYTKKVAIRKSRAEKEVENNLQARKTESSETTRAEKEIIDKALRKTNFELTAEGGVKIGIAEAKGSTKFSQESTTESQEVKKEFREAVFKAAEEYKSERTMEINVSTGEETTFEESGEISNPNDEIPVTYLFYELQRRYRVSEQIHRITPVVLVAQEFPKPNEIDEDWIIANDWILRRVILDDSFIPAMNYLASKVVGDEFALQEMYQNLQQHRRIVEDLKDDLVAIQAQVGRRYGALQRSLLERAAAIEKNEESDDFSPIPTPVGIVFAPTGGDDTSTEAMQVREDAARDAYEREAKKEKELEARLERETTALNELTETYTKNLSDHLNRKMQIARLRVHIKSNIMYYMQAIWSHEPPDQRFFRLHEVPVPKLKGKMTYKIEVDPDLTPMPPDWKKPYKLTAKCELDPELEFETLEEIADLDNLLGFKGNYMMFPLKKSNHLTDFMMIPYLDVTGIIDPDPLGNWTLTDFAKYVCCLHKTYSKAEFEKLLPGLQAAYQKLVNTPGADGEEIVVPTDSLFIEALPGVHPILEDFKLFHRVIDVKKVQAEVRAAEMENIRMAARLLAGEREDPTIEKKIVVEGGQSVIVSPEDT